MTTLIIVLSSLLGLWLTWKYFQKNLVQIAERNKTITEPWKRTLNYPLTILWYGYLMVFFLGLTINNLLLSSF